MYPTIDTAFDASGYYGAQEETYMYAATLGERQLWCAIIEQAFIDVGVISDQRGAGRETISIRADIQKNSRTRKYYDDAARWLLHGKQDFIYVCMMAGISPSIIRRAALQRLVKA